MNSDLLHETGSESVNILRIERVRGFIQRQNTTVLTKRVG